MQYANHLKTNITANLFQLNQSQQSSLSSKQATVESVSSVADASTAETQVALQINQQGLGLLRQFERLPSYAEQSVREIEQAVLQQVTVPLTVNQFSALVSLTYNLGEANLRRSKLLRYLNKGHYQAAADEFERWVYVGANRLPRLVARRRAEKQLFLQS